MLRGEAPEDTQRDFNDRIEKSHSTVLFQPLRACDCDWDEGRGGCRPTTPIPIVSNERLNI